MFLEQKHFDALISVGNALIMHRRGELLNLHSFDSITACILLVSFLLLMMQSCKEQTALPDFQCIVSET